MPVTTGWPSASTIKISVRGLQKRFIVHGQPVDALAGLDLDIRFGELFCIVGPSGCGKTTLLRILAGLETRTSGHVMLARDDAGQHDRSGRGNATQRPSNSMIFQEQSMGVE